MTLTQLQYFLATAKELHFGRAARTLHIAQPSLSRSLANLEEELGLPLFERRGHSVSLTEAGVLLQAQAERILCQVDATQRQLLRLKTTSDEEVSLGYTSTALAAGLGERLRAFTQAYRGGLRLSTDQTTTADAVQGLKDGRYDLALCMKVEKEPEIRQALLFRAPCVLVVPKDSPLTDGCTPQQAVEYPFVIYRASVARKFVEELFQRVGVRPDFCHLTYNDEASIQLVGEGLGISVVNKMFCRRTDRVRVLHPAWLDCPQDIYLSRRAAGKLGRAAQDLEQFLQREPLFR